MDEGDGDAYENDELKSTDSLTDVTITIIVELYGHSLTLSLSDSLVDPNCSRILMHLKCNSAD